MLSLRRPVKEPSFFRSYQEWLKEHVLWLWPTLITTVFSFFGTYIFIPPEFTLWAILGAVVGILLLTGTYFYWKHWMICELYAVRSYYYNMPNRTELDNLLLYTGASTDLILWFRFGSNIKDWTIRFRIPNDCVLVNINNHPGWKVAVSRNRGWACISGNRTKEIEQFILTLRANDETPPITEVNLEVHARTNQGGFPSNSDECSKLTMAHELPIHGLVVG